MKTIRYFKGTVASLDVRYQLIIWEDNDVIVFLGEDNQPFTVQKKIWDFYMVGYDR